MVSQNGKLHYSVCSLFFFFFWLLLGLVVWPRLDDPFVSQNPKEVCASHSPRWIPGYAYTCLHDQISTSYTIPSESPGPISFMSPRASPVFTIFSNQPLKHHLSSEQLYNLYNIYKQIKFCSVISLYCFQNALLFFFFYIFFWNHLIQSLLFLSNKPIFFQLYIPQFVKKKKKKKKKLVNRLFFQSDLKVNLMSI